MIFLEFIKKFPNEKVVANYFLKIRYPYKIACHHCGSIRVYQRKDNIKLFDCADCHNTFSPFKDTIFEKSSTDLRKWMYAIHLFLNGKKGISAMQLMRETGVTYKTAWRMLQQIRKAMGNKEQEQFFNTIIEIDETYVGGKPRKSNNRDDDDDNPPSASNKRGRGTNKVPVVGVMTETTRKFIAKLPFLIKKVKNLQVNNCLMFLTKFVSRTAITL